MTRSVYALTYDRSLSLVTPPSCMDAVATWLPRMREVVRDEGDSAPDSAVIEIRDADPDPSGPPAVPPTLRLFGVRAHLDDRTGLVDLRASTPACAGSIDLRSGRARIHASRNGERARIAADLFTMLTISSAMLLGRLKQALLHAAAVVDPEGHAWLLVGDTHAGKTTTTINLVEAGWSFLSDDHVVVSLSEADHTVVIEGWPRPFHIDEGWEQDRVTGRRTAVDPSFLGPERWRRTAPLAGLLFPRVRPDGATNLEPVSSGTALADLIRQTPWFLADRLAAPRVLSLLQRMVELPVYRLSLGRETYRNPGLLLARCASLPVSRTTRIAGAGTGRGKTRASSVVRSALQSE